MAYESKVYIVEHISGFEYGNRIAEVRLSKMSCESGWRELFTKNIDYKLFMDDGNTEFDTDRYGEHLKSCSIEVVTEWVEKEMQHSGYNWRLPILYGLLKGFAQANLRKLEVVHFGY